ncbi:lipase family protein [Actinophytocola oryzae]|uniref:Secretory lipase n=1 Tax=Actinophytocola oryzae TaxID=502181 RepID=A0A4R7VVQ8_9PSEU|nr:lipase family protein [Actinophytocola oryzae]TDV53539.1 secretory lipase [Actinophytocola oryzae]
MRTGEVLERHPLPAEFLPGHAEDGNLVRYRGVGHDGIHRVVSGSVFVPVGPAPPGGWPVVSFAHGTTGLADHLAPSRVGLTRYERDHVARWLAEGFVVAAVDYEGLATPGPHPYFHGEAVADDVIDIVRAARELHDQVGRRWVVAGFSHGAHAALFTGLVASRYAPELDFRGTIALAPPVHLPELVRYLTGGGDRPVSLLLPFLLAGVGDDGARPFLTETGRRLVDLATRATLVDMYGAVAGLTNADAGMTDIHRHPGVTRVLRACRVPVTRMDRPVYLTAGSADEIVPAEIVAAFVADLRWAGADVRFDRHEGATHVELLCTGLDRVVAWASRMVRTRTGFDWFDADHDGRLTCDDFTVYALRLAQACGCAPGAGPARAVRTAYAALWRAFAARTGTDADDSVDRTEFTHRVETGAGFAREIAALADAVLCMAAGSDSVSAEEIAAAVRHPGRTDHWLFARV